MNVTITDSSKTNRLCLVIFVPRRLPIVKVHFNIVNDVANSICYHEYYKEKMTVNEDFFLSSIKISGGSSFEGVKIPNFFKESGVVCVDL